jgi:TetR/AcrR family transcriptional regulator, cholesterol catabolism regulator
MGRPVKRIGRLAAQGARRANGREVETTARREELVAAAGRVFSRKGVGNTTMRDIAEEAGILAGSLYHHFESKDALLEEVLRGELEELTRLYEAVRDSELDPGAALEELLLVGLQFVINQHDATAIVENDYSYLHDIPLFGFVEDYASRHRRIWRDVLERGVDAGMFRSDLDLDVLYRSMMGSIVAVVRWYRPGRTVQVEELAATHATLYLRGLTV